jgi:hypothetical protein
MKSLRLPLICSLNLFVVCAALAAEMQTYKLPRGARPHDVAPDPSPVGPSGTRHRVRAGWGGSTR